MLSFIKCCKLIFLKVKFNNMLDVLLPIVFKPTNSSLAFIIYLNESIQCTQLIIRFISLQKIRKLDIFPFIYEDPNLTGSL